jgi:hypothetical protein
MPSLREQSAISLTRRWEVLAVGVVLGKAVLAIAYVIGAFTLASFARTREDPTVPLAAFFLLAAVSAIGWLAATYFQELADSIQTFHAATLTAFAESFSEHDVDARARASEAFLAGAGGFTDAVSAIHADYGGFVVALLWRGAVVVVPPLVGWLLKPF